MDLTFQDQVQRYAEGRATAAEVQALCERLRTSADARRDFITLMNLESALESMAAEWAAAHAQLPAAAVSPPQRRRLVRKRYLVAFAACLALLGVHLWQDHVRQRIHATVENGAGVRELPDGTQLRNEWIEIAGGTVELITPTAARIVIEAPATFRFDSSQRLTMTRGRLAADIPRSARKFTVVTPSGEAVDLGTKFGVDVPLRSEAEIHVFQGEVVAQSSNGGKRQHLHSGEAFQLKSGAGAARQLRSAAFIRPEEINSLHAALSAGQPLRADEALQILRQDAALVALLDFESPQLPPGVFDCVQGRWPNSQAAEFVGAGDHIRLDLRTAGEWPQLTVAAWVRLNQYENIQQSLLRTIPANGDLPSDLSWIVTDQKVMQLSIAGTVFSPQSDGPAAANAPSLFPWGQDRWVHLAVAYDLPNRQVRFFLNGRLEGTAVVSDAQPLRFKRLEIGNAPQAHRKLSGRMDEFLLLGRALSNAEILELYETGNPYR